MFQLLENRRLLSSVGMDGNHYIVVIGDDDRAERIDVRLIAGPAIEVSYNGEASMTVGVAQVHGIFIQTGGGDDTVILDSSIKGAFIDAGDGNDTAIGGNGNDIILGGAGNDAINGRGGSDRIAGQDGNDAIKGMAGFDVIDGGAGNDLILGGLSADRLNGGNGRDFLLGEGGSDTLYGGSDYSSDTCWGGAGIDRFYQQGGNSLAFKVQFDTDSDDETPSTLA